MPWVSESCEYYIVVFLGAPIAMLADILDFILELCRVPRKVRLYIAFFVAICVVLVGVAVGLHRLQALLARESSSWATHIAAATAADHPALVKLSSITVHIEIDTSDLCGMLSAIAFLIYETSLLSMLCVIVVVQRVGRLVAIAPATSCIALALVFFIRKHIMAQGGQR